MSDKPSLRSTVEVRLLETQIFNEVTELVRKYLEALFWRHVEHLESDPQAANKDFYRDLQEVCHIKDRVALDLAWRAAKAAREQINGIFTPRQHQPSLPQPSAIESRLVPLP